MNFQSQARDWPNSAASRFVAAGGLTWHVQDIGSGPVLLLVHGTGASTHSWRKLVARLQKHGAAHHACNPSLFTATNFVELRQAAQTGGQQGRKPVLA